MKTPEFLEKCRQGPVMFLTVIPNGPPAMGLNLVQWFLYCLGVGIFCALVAGSAFGPGTGYHAVFHIVALTAFCGYALALLQGSIWYKRRWSSTLKLVFDGAVYALLTAGTFGWLWP